MQLSSNVTWGYRLIMKISDIHPPLQKTGVLHPSIALKYRPALDWLNGRTERNAIIEANAGDRRLDRAVIEHLFNLVPVTSMDAQRLEGDDAKRMLEILVDCLKDGYFLREIQRVSLEEIASNHPNGISNKVKQVNVGDSWEPVARIPSKTEWLDLLIAKDKAMALRYLSGLKIEGMGHYVNDYFSVLGDHPTLFEGLESQRALKLYKIFGWEGCKQQMQGYEAAQALELDLAL